MALARPYTTVDRVRAEIRNDDTEITSKIETAINDASRVIDEFCGHDFWFHDHTEEPLVVPRSQIIGNSIFLPWPVLELTAIIQNETEITATQYYHENQAIIGAVEWAPTNEAPILLSGTFGYDLAETDPETKPPVNLPAGVVRAATLIAAAWSGEYSIERVGQDGQRVSIASSTIPKEAEKLLARYRTLVI